MIKLGIVTSTRAEYGLLYPVIKKFRNKENSDFTTELIVTGTHLSKSYGMTINEIKSDYTRIDEEIKIPVKSKNPVDISKNMADTLTKFSELFYKKKYHAILVLGDRYEILSVVIAARLCNIPVIHLCGGDTTEGAIDESIRHSITKMSHLHFVTNEESKKRVIQLGEDPDCVINSGSTSIDNILNEKLPTKTEVLNELGLEDKEYAICTYHPVTLENNTQIEQIYEFIKAIKNHPEIEFIVTKSNSDLGGAEINHILDVEDKRIQNLHVYSSLGMKRYLALMKEAKFVLGNSSSGILETPAFHVPTINIGDRQKGRLQCKNIINCDVDYSSIEKAISTVINPEFKANCMKYDNPYGNGKASEVIVERTLDVLKQGINIQKRFYDIEVSK